MSDTANSTSYQKVAECLYRNESSGRYYAFVKKSGKQIRHSLKTKDRKFAEHKLREFRKKLSGLVVSEDKPLQLKLRLPKASPLVVFAKIATQQEAQPIG